MMVIGEGDAQADGQLDRYGRQGERLGHPTEQAGPDRVGVLGGVEVLAEDDELIAVQPGDGCPRHGAGD